MRRCAFLYKPGYSPEMLDGLSLSSPLAAPAGFVPLSWRASDPFEPPLAAEEATPFLVEPKPSEADLAEDEVLEVLDLVRGGMAVVGGLRRAGGDRACQEAGRGGAGRVRGDLVVLGLHEAGQVSLDMLLSSVPSSVAGVRASPTGDDEGAGRERAEAVDGGPRGPMSSTRGEQGLAWRN